MRAVTYITLLFIASASAVVNIPCEFAFTPRGYECRLPDVDISVFDDFTIQGGAHLPNQNDAMVVSFMSVHNNFREFPTSHLVRFPNLNHITVSGSLITELPAMAVAGRPLLRTLSLANNEIERIDPIAFQGTTDIFELNLMFNRLRSIDNVVFAQFTNVTLLDLSFNLLERIVANTFVNNPAVQMLNLNSNRISHVNQSFFENVAGLTTFLLSANICYDGSFFNIHLGPNRVDMFNRLQTCFVDSGVNWRCRFDRNFEGIDFDNRYTCLLRGIEAYDYGKIVNLGGIHAPGLSNVDVTYAWVDSSNVRFIIRQLFVDFVNLVGLHITSSNLQVIQPGAFQGANNLRYLTVSLNDLRGLDANTFQGAANLQVIQFFNNHLEYIHVNAFAGLTQLRELHLIGGHLNSTTIPPYTFSPLINLQLVEFSQNEVGVIDSRWFANNTMLRDISFNFNRVYAVYNEIVDKPFLTTLRLRDNICIDNVFSITPATREQVRTALSPCIEQYPLRRQTFIMELEGDMNILDGDGNVIGML